MLILSRKVNEQIVIGDNIVVTVVAIRGTSVRLGVEAPTDVPVHRQEVYDMLQKQRREQEADRTRADRANDAHSPISPGRE